MEKKRVARPKSICCPVGERKEVQGRRKTQKQKERRGNGLGGNLSQDLFFPGGPVVRRLLGKKKKILPERKERTVAQKKKQNHGRNSP